MAQVNLQSQIAFNGAQYPLTDTELVKAISDLLIKQILDQYNRFTLEDFKALENELPSLQLIGEVQHFTNHLQ